MFRAFSPLASIGPVPWPFRPGWYVSGRWPSCLRRLCRFCFLALQARLVCFGPSALWAGQVAQVLFPGPSGQADMSRAVGAEEEEPTLRLWRGFLTQPPLRPKVSDTERTNAARMCVCPCPHLTGAQPWRAAAIQWPVGKPALRCADPGTDPGRATRYVTSPLWRGLLTKPPPVARLPIPSHVHTLPRSRAFAGANLSLPSARRVRESRLRFGARRRPPVENFS